MEIYTIGFTRKTAEQFFGILRRAGIRRLIDVRLNNSSQLAGFTKNTDLPFFLKELCAADYVHEPLLTPTADLLDSYRNRTIKWPEYESGFRQLMAERRIESTLNAKLLQTPSVLLCSEPTADKCHRRLAAEHLRDAWSGTSIVHL